MEHFHYAVPLHSNATHTTSISNPPFMRPKRIVISHPFLCSIVTRKLRPPTFFHPQVINFSPFLYDYNAYFIQWRNTPIFSDRYFYLTILNPFILRVTLYDFNPSPLLTRKRYCRGKTFSTSSGFSTPPLLNVAVM